jgi:hypothetical protein
MARVKMNVNRMPVTKVVEQAEMLRQGLTNNPNFPNPDPTPDEIAAQLTETQAEVLAYESAVLAAKEQLTRRNQSVSRLRALLMCAGAHVDSRSSGSPQKILSANLSVRKDNAPVGKLSRVEGLALAHDMVGQVSVKWKKVRGAPYYEVQEVSGENPADTNGQLLASTNRCKTLLCDLKSGTRIFLQVRAMGAAGPGPWSNSAWITVP